MMKLPLAISIAETVEARGGEDVQAVAERLHREHPEADSSSEDIVEILQEALHWEEEVPGRLA
jgi:hypothetical protein